MDLSNIKITFVLIISIAFSNLSQAQDVEGLWNQIKGLKDKVKEKFENPVNISGGINATSNYNYVQGIPPRTDPFSYQLGANLKLDILGIAIPLNFNYSNGRAVYHYQLPSYELPSFALLGFSPSYKWATLHIGDRSMTFSPYTLAGHSFRGLGVELKPKNFRFQAMYGRLQRARAEDLNALQNIEAVYKRMGWGFRTGYDNGKDNIYATLFEAWDDPTSIPALQNPLSVTPADNTVFSLTGKKHIGERITLAVDYARSGLTENRLSEQLQDRGGILQTFAGLFNPSSSTGYYNAIKTSLGFKVNFGELQFQHEWVDPGYRSLGALFFNNDFENWTIAPKLVLWDKKVMLSANVGVQRNNLKGNQTNTSRRLIASINANIKASEKLNINAAYSNFKNTNRLRATSVPFVQVDSIILSQVNQNASINCSYITGEEKNALFSLLLSYQNANSIENDVVIESQVVSTYTANLTHSYTFVDPKLVLSASFLAHYSKIPNISIFSLAPTLAASKAFLDNQLKLTLSNSYVIANTNGINSNNIITSQLSAKYQFFKKHSLDLSASIVNQNVKSELAATPNFTEMRGKLTYGFTF